MEGGTGSVQLVQRSHPPLEIAVERLVQPIPFELAVVVPFAALPDLSAHEQELLARVREHVTEQCPQVGELLIRVARHLGEE